MGGTGLTGLMTGQNRTALERHCTTTTRPDFDGDFCLIVWRGSKIVPLIPAIQSVPDRQYRWHENCINLCVDRFVFVIAAVLPPIQLV
jgi:hypothetical protein